MSMQKSRRQFSAKEKFDAVRQVIAKAKTVSQISEELGVHPNVYYRWQTEFFEGALERFETKKRGRKSTRRQKEIEKAEEEIRRLNSVITEVVKENVELKKSMGLVKGGHCKEEHKKEILSDMAITQTRTQWSKAKLFALYEVTKSTVHRWENECIDIPTKVKHPETNGKIERFIGLVRQEALRPNSPVSLDDAKKVLASFVEYYNNKKNIHHAIGYVKLVDLFTCMHEEIITEQKTEVCIGKEKVY